MEERELSQQEKIWKGTGVFWHAIKPLLLYLFLPPAISSVAVALTGAGEDLELFIWRSGQFYRTLGIILTFYLLHRRCKKRKVSIWDETTLYWRQMNARKALLLTVAGAGLSLFISAALTVCPLPEFLIGSYHRESSQIYGRIDTGLAILSVILLAPIVEEIIFRGYVLNRMLQGYREPRTAVLASSFLFAVCHASPLWILYALFMGLLMAHVSIVEDNIAYSVALHLGYNLTTLPLWLINRSPEASKVFYASPVLIAAYGVIGLATALLCLKAYPLDLRQLGEYMPWHKEKKGGLDHV